MNSQVGYEPEVNIENEFKPEVRVLRFDNEPREPRGLNQT